MQPGATRHFLDRQPALWRQFPKDPVHLSQPASSKRPSLALFGGEEGIQISCLGGALETLEKDVMLGDHLGKRPLELFLEFTDDNGGSGPLASTNSNGPEENQSINNGLGWHCPPVPSPGVRVAGKPGLHFSSGIKTSFQGNISQT